MLGRKVSFIQMIVETSWCTENDLRSYLTHHPMFIHRHSASIASHGTQTTSHILENSSRLQGKFSSWCNHNSLRHIIASIHQLGKGQEIGQGLSTSRRRKHHHIFVTSQQGMHCILLHGIRGYPHFI